MHSRIAIASFLEERGEDDLEGLLIFEEGHDWVEVQVGEDSADPGLDVV